MITAQRWRLPHVMHYVGWPLVVLFIWDVVIAVDYVEFRQHWLAVDNLPMPLLGSALALLLTIRNNNAYARWWEARQLWGGIVNNSRTFARQLRLYLPDNAAATTFANLQVAYAHALRCHLRKQPPWDQITHLVRPELCDRLRTSSNVPDAILRHIADQLATLLRDGVLDTIQMAAFDDTMAALGNMQGGMERIKNTPLPRQYTIFPRTFVQVFCVLLPLAMVADLGLATPLGSTLVGFILLALDRVGADLENPFSNTIYDVPMTSITRTIEINLGEAFGRQDLPAPLEPQDGVLW